MSGGKRFITVLFGPLGDGLMALALFDDIARLAPGSSLVILTRRGAGMLRLLAGAYPQIEVREIPRGPALVPFFAAILLRPGWTFLMLGLMSYGYSLPLRLFVKILSLVPGNRTIGFDDPWFDVSLKFDISLLMIENLRRLLPHALPAAKIGIQPPPRFEIPVVRPAQWEHAPSSYVVVHIFGASIAHALPPARWRGLLAHIAQTNPDMRILLTGTQEQRPRAQELQAGLERVEAHTDLSILELAWVVDNAALYIGIDTGVTHIAGMLGQKSLIIRHCADPTWRPLYNPHARIIYNAARCTPDDPASCVMVQEGGQAYRRCAYDISNTLLFESVELALSSPKRDVAGFAGVIDERQSSL